MILKCICEHDHKGNTAAADFQDQRYGSHNRIHNHAKNVYRCTVCKRERKKEQ